jgi:hypothetical protein
MKKILFLGIIATLILIVYIFIHNRPADVALIKYSNAEFGFEFFYPENWYMDHDDLPNGTIQLFNDLLGPTKNDPTDIFPEKRDFKKTNKIEIVVVNRDRFDAGPSDIFPEKTRKVSEVTVDGQISTRTHVELKGGSMILGYVIPIKGFPNMIMSIAIHGNKDNFYVLDQIVETINFI